MKLHLIRHGKTAANEQRLYCGQTDLPLSENGIALIKTLKEQGVYPENIDLFFTSGLLRANQTINGIYGAVDTETIAELAEFKFGQFEMKSHEDLKEYPDYQAWITDETGRVPCPGGESRQQFSVRVLAGYGLLMKKSANAESSLLVSHGGVIAFIMDYLFPNAFNFYEWQPEPGRGYTLFHTSDRLHKYKKI